MNTTSIGRLPKSIAQVLRFLKPGGLYQPIVFNNCFTIVRLEQIIPAKLNSPTAQSLLNELFETWVQNQLKILETQQNFI